MFTASSRGIFYQRSFPELGKSLSLRKFTSADLGLFHRWHNLPRVAHFWKLQGSLEEHAAYIQRTLNDPHEEAAIIEADGTPVGYVEFYWIKDDELAKYCEAQDFDRGFHFLVGERKFLGRQNTQAVVQAILHHIYQDEPRTRRVLVEPRVDNDKVLRYARTEFGWRKLKEFEAPGWRSVLLENRREDFFRAFSH